MRKLTLFLLLIAPSLFAEDEPTIERYTYGREFVNMLITLVFVLALIFVSVWFLKKVMRGRLNSWSRSHGIRVLEKRHLGQKSALYLVDILGKGVVISESAAGIHTVVEFPQDVNVELLLSELHETSSPKVSFKEMMQNKIRSLRRRDEPS